MRTKIEKAKAMEVVQGNGNSNHDDGNYNNNNDNKSKNFSCSSATDWTVVGGSLNTSVAFETSDSPIDSETLYSKRKPPLILKPPSSDCGPCEIKLSFTQKHEVRQVYIRSTARVFEIYFAPSLHSGNEYLCTVRCGIAYRDGKVLHPTNTEEPADAQPDGSAGELSKDKCNDDGKFASNEDDWVKVKVPDLSLQDNQNTSMPKKIDVILGTSIQDFYEATAEIADADACISLTLRLLSLESKGCLYVDEIYVFADIVEPADSETQAPQVGNYAGNSLMAMLAPTLLQLSKTGINRRADEYSDTTEKGESMELGSRVTDSNNIVDKIHQEESIAAQQDVKLLEVTEPKPQFPILAQVSDQRHDPVAKNNVPNDHFERVLEQIVSRVSRIEDVCLRFEENMLKPISSMEARLQRVEQKMEMLTKNFQYSGSRSGARISAPAFLCNGSNSVSFCNEGSDCSVWEAFELEKKDIPYDELSNPPEDIAVSVNDTQFLPSLVVTAPEFSCGDDEENNDAVEPLDDCPQEKMKQALSIDDALAAALAGFLSTSSVQPSDYTQTLAVKAPDFTIEENGDEGEVTSLGARSDEPVVPPIFSYESNGQCMNDSISTCSSSPSILGMGQVMGNLDDDCFKETFQGVHGHDQLHKGNASCSSLGTSANCLTSQAEHGVLAQTDDCQTAVSTGREEASNGIDIPVSEKTDILRQFLQSETSSSSDAFHGGAVAGAKDVVEGSKKDVLQNIFKFPSTSCVLDFELPILDVKFASWETSRIKSPLGGLLSSIPEFEVEAPCVQQRDNTVIGEQSNLILVEDGDQNCPATSDSLLVDWDGYDVRDVSSHVDGEARQDFSICNEQERYESLI